VTAETRQHASSLYVCTIVTRSEVERVGMLEARVARPVDAVILDSEEIRELLGDDHERFLAGFTAAELVLAVLPRVLLRAIDSGARMASYMDALCDPNGELERIAGGGVRVDPWPLGASDRVGAVAVPSTAPARDLLTRWSELASGVLAEYRPLTSATTGRWLSALAEVIPGLSVVPAGVTGSADHPKHREHGSGGDYGYDSLPGGLRLTPALRRLLARGPFDRPFSEPVGDALISWLAEPASSSRSIPRYLNALRNQRSDVRARFPTPDDPRLLSWAERHERRVDPVLAAVLDARARVPSDLGGAGRRRRPGFGVNAVSYWSSELGIADAARLLVLALDTARVPVQPISISGFLPPARQAANSFGATGPDAAPHGLNLLAMNPDGVLAFDQEAPRTFLRGRPTVGYWWWEILDAFPDAWRAAFDLIDEVWVGSRHVRSAIEPTSPKPVRVLPIPVLPLSERVAPRALDLPDGFLFMTVFDYNSTYARKNPLATVRAFRNAFPPGSGASLIVKSINGENSPDDRDELTIVADGHPDIHLIDRYMSAEQVDLLLACADCVVSLHRAEGFGIPLARALRTGIPVVATAYGGNLDFMSDDNSFLVEYTPGIVPEGILYPAGARWAEPDIDHATLQLQRVLADTEGARAKARKAAAALSEEYSARRAGARMAEELERLHDHGMRRRPVRRLSRRAASRRRDPT
jgi:glycosyltransferase involved in cell wall biosynthesis